MASFINVPPPNRGPSIGEQIGRGFGEGFGGGVQQAASGFLQGKIQQMFQQQERDRMLPIAQKLTKSFGLSEDLAPIIADNPSIVPTILANAPRTSSNILGTSGRVGRIPQTSNQSIPTPEIDQNTQQTMQTQPRSLDQRARGVPEEEYIPFVREEAQREARQAPYNAQMMAQAAQTVQSEQQGQSGGFPSPMAGGVQVPESPIKPELGPYQEAFKNAKTKTDQDKIEKAWIRDNENFRKDLGLYNKAIVQKQTTEQGRRALNKDTESYFNSIKEKAKSARDSEPELKALYKLSEKGGDVTKWKTIFAKGMGIPEEALFNANDDTIAKISANYLPEYVRKFAGQGGKVFASEINSGIKAIPSLMQTEGGRKRISKYFLNNNRIPILLEEEGNKILSEYRKRGEVMPDQFEFENELGRRTAEKIRKIHEDAFRIAIENPNVPPGKARISIPGSGIQQIPAESVGKFVEKYGAEIVWD
jgi:hypothetical protein